MDILRFNNVYPHTCFPCYYINGEKGYIINRVDDCYIDDNLRFNSRTLRIHGAYIKTTDHKEGLVWSTDKKRYIKIFLYKCDAYNHAASNIKKLKLNLAKHAFNLNKQLINENF